MISFCRKLWRTIKGYLIPLNILIIIILLIFGMSAAGISLSSVGIFILFLSFCVIMPGYILARKCGLTGSSSELYAFSALFGIAICIIFYFLDNYITRTLLSDICLNLSVYFDGRIQGLSAMFENRALFMCCGGPIMSAVAIPLIFTDVKKGQLSAKSFVISDKIILAVLAATFLSFCAISLKSGINPSISGSVTGFVDFPWGISNTAALLKGFPAQTPQYSGATFNYHFFSSIFRVNMIRFTGFSAVDVTMTASPFIMAPLTVFSLDVLGRLWLKNERKVLFFIYSCLFVYFVCRAPFFFWDIDKAFSLLNSWGVSTAFRNFLCYPNGIDLAFPSLALLSVMILRINTEKPCSIWYYIAIAMLTGVCTGSKAPFSLCLLAVVAATVIFRLIQGKRLSKSINIIICFAVVAISFFAVYRLLLYNGSGDYSTVEVSPEYADASIDSVQHNNEAVSEQVYETNNNRIILATLVETSDFFKQITSGVSLTDSQTRAMAIALIPLHLLFLLPMAFFPMLFYFIEKLRHFKSITYREIIACGMCVCSILVSYLMYFDGQSVIHFMFAGTAFMQLIAVEWLFNNFKSLTRTLKTVIAVVSIFGLMTGILSSAYEIREGMRTASEIVFSSKYTVQNKDIADASITKYEYEAMIWLKDNTKQDSVIAVDRHGTYRMDADVAPTPNDQARYFYYTAYSERQAFLGGWGYMSRTKKMRDALIIRKKVNDLLYDPEVINKVEIMEANDIDYLVVSRYKNPDMDIGHNGLVMVFENRDIKIYALP